MNIFENETKMLGRITEELVHTAAVTRREIENLKAAEKLLADAGHELDSALADAALRADDSGLTTAREKVATRRAELEEQRRRLKAVRVQLWVAGARCAKEGGTLNTESLDAEADEAVRKFGDEWERATAAFALVRARRQALEGLLAYKLCLPDQASSPAASSSVADIMPTHAALDDFRGALGRVMQFSPEMVGGGIEALEGEEVTLHRTFLTAFRERELAEQKRNDRLRRESPAGRPVPRPKRSVLGALLDQ